MGVLRQRSRSEDVQPTYHILDQASIVALRRVFQQLAEPPILQVKSKRFIKHRNTYDFCQEKDADTARAPSIK